ncbi:MAG: hypothetical protein V8Q42_03160 [Anaerovoracaceae bacterium]
MSAQLQEKLQKLLMQSVSYYDTMGENFYHGLTLGLCAVMDSSYRIVVQQGSRRWAM